MSYCCCTPQIHCRYCQKAGKPFRDVQPFFNLNDKPPQRQQKPIAEDLETALYKADYWKRMHDEVRAELIRGLNAQPEQEPVAKYTGETYRCPMVILYKDIPIGTLLYTTPPQRTAAEGEDSKTWVGLTPDDFRQLEKETTVNGYNGDYCPTWDLIEAVEEKLKEKNT